MDIMKSNENIKQNNTRNLQENKSIPLVCGSYTMRLMFKP